MIVRRCLQQPIIKCVRIVANYSSQDVNNNKSGAEETVKSDGLFSIN